MFDKSAVVAYCLISLGMSVNVAGAANISSLQNTGVGTYTWQVVSSFGGYVGNTTNTNTSLTPFANTAVDWTINSPGANPAGSTGSAQWIATANDGASITNQYYSYRTTFDLTTFDLWSVDIQGGWASDNRGRAIFVNGREITNYLSGLGVGVAADGLQDKNQGSSSLSFFEITSADSLLSGINTIDFVFRNGRGDTTSGLYVEFSRATATATATVPEPEMLFLFGIGGIAMFGFARRKI